jgi:hypothetical protein
MKTMTCTMLALLAYCASSVLADDCCDRCQHCGCQCAPQKVCRLVTEIKKVPKVTYSCECEDFCIPGPSQKCVTCGDDCDCPKKKVVYTPTCAKVHTRTKLIKHETMEEKCTYKWVVENICPTCAGQCANQQRPVPEGELGAAQSQGESVQVGYQSSENAGNPAAAPAKSSLRRVLDPIFFHKS